MDAGQPLAAKTPPSSSRLSRFALVTVVVVLFTAIYAFRSYRNLSTQEAMDFAQLARNIAQGEGYRTLFIRPLSIYLLRTHQEAKSSRNDLASSPLTVPVRESETNAIRLPPNPLQDPGQMKRRCDHPDLANPPVYPFALACLMRVCEWTKPVPLLNQLLPFRYTVNITDDFWSVPSPKENVQASRQFWRYQPDFLIFLFNLFLYFAVIVLVFRLALRLFDVRVAWVSAALTFANELLWRFSNSGLSTILLMLTFMSLIWCLVLLEGQFREPQPRPGKLLLLSGLMGVLVALSGLTRYSFCVLILPVLGFVLLFAGQRRIAAAMVVLFAFIAAISPWIIRNYTVCGTPFGTATYTVLETTQLFPENRLQRSLDPDLTFAGMTAVRVAWYKLMINSRQLIQADLPKFGGTWLSALFLVGLMIRFNNIAIRRLRCFLVASLLLLAVTQALGRTQISEDSPDINSENLLVVLTPLVILFGVSLFFTLADQIRVPFLELRHAPLALFMVVGGLPLLLTFLPPRAIPLAYPPYYPPAIQIAAGYVKNDELTMSDVPWAMAWYGQTQSAWLTLNPESDFFTLNDNYKPVQELYLSYAILDSRFRSQWFAAAYSKERTWGDLILQCAMDRTPPRGFPLTHIQSGWPDQLLLTFRQKPLPP
jgi:hypothetical protein